MVSREKAIRRQAREDYGRGTVSATYRLYNASWDENDEASPIGLLYVYADLVEQPVGFVPLLFPKRVPDRSHDMVVTSMTPDEVRQVQSGELPLPPGWRLGQLIPPFETRSR